MYVNWIILSHGWRTYYILNDWPERLWLSSVMESVEKKKKFVQRHCSFVFFSRPAVHREQSEVKILKFSCFWNAPEEDFLAGKTLCVTSKWQIEKKRMNDCWSVWLGGFLYHGQTLRFVQTWLMWPQLSVICLHVKLIEQQRLPSEVEQWSGTLSYLLRYEEQECVGGWQVFCVGSPLLSVI